MLKVFQRSRAARALVVMALLSALFPAPLTAQPSDTSPAPLSAEVLERFITCYPRVDAVRDQFREEVARLEQRHKFELERLHQQLFGGNGPHHALNPDAMISYGQKRDSLVRLPAGDRVFLPVVRDCGFDSIADYATALYAVIHHFPRKPGWLRPYMDRVEGLRVPNLN